MLWPRSALASLPTTRNSPWWLFAFCDAGPPCAGRRFFPSQHCIRQALPDAARWGSALHSSRQAVCSLAMGPIPRSWLRLGRAVAASVSEWKSIHSLTLAATAEMKRVEGNWHRGGSIKCPGACPGNLYWQGRAGKGYTKVRDRWWLIFIPGCLITNTRRHRPNPCRGSLGRVVDVPLTPRRESSKNRRTDFRRANRRRAW